MYTTNSTVSKHLRNIVAERDSYTCVLCTNAYTDMHHFIPRSKGGRNVPHNLVSLCRTCHGKVHHEIPTTQEEDDEIEYRLVEYLSDYYADDDDYWNDAADYWRRMGYGNVVDALTKYWHDTTPT